MGPSVPINLDDQLVKVLEYNGYLYSANVVKVLYTLIFIDCAFVDGE